MRPRRLTQEGLILSLLVSAKLRRQPWHGAAGSCDVKLPIILLPFARRWNSKLSSPCLWVAALLCKTIVKLCLIFLHLSDGGVRG